MTAYFKILTDRFYVLNIRIKFLANRILFTIPFINLFFMQNFRL